MPFCRSHLSRDSFFADHVSVVHLSRPLSDFISSLVTGTPSLAESSNLAPFFLCFFLADFGWGLAQVTLSNLLSVQGSQNW